MIGRSSIPSLCIALLAFLLAGCSSPSGQDLCRKSTARQARCQSLSPCEVDRLNAQCDAYGMYLSSQLVGALNNCNLDSLPCDATGDMMQQVCAQNGLNAAIMGAGYQRVVNAFCTACPALSNFGASPPPTTAQCVHSGSTPVSASSDGGISTATNPFLLFAEYSDSALDPITTCLQQLTSTGAQACQDAQACVMRSPVYATLSGGVDAGTCPSTGDASTNGG